jgi:hypothetical protein
MCGESEESDAGLDRFTVLKSDKETEAPPKEEYAGE